MILGIFYARFLPQEGTKIVAQSPPGCIVASPDTLNLKPPLLDFDIIQEYVIPRKAFFNRFITVNSPDDKYSVLGFPVSIPNERYHRNEFLFNFGLVVESDVDQIPYERLVRRLAFTFAEMERQNGYLSFEGTSKAAEDGRRPIESLLEIIKEDLNNYGECMIPIDEANTLNMKLFPYQAPPPAVRGWHVPVPKVKLGEIVDPTWDLTLQKIIPHIDGVNDVRRIAWLADVALPLAQVALRHLLYYDTVLLLDLFFFGSCYAPRPGIHDFVANRDGLVDECAAYVGLRPPPRPAGSRIEDHAVAATTTTTATGTTSLPGSRKASATGVGLGIGKGESLSGQAGTAGSGTSTLSATMKGGGGQVVLTHYQLIKLMTTFCMGRSVMEWVKLHRDAGFDVLRHVDVRRLVQFGVIKGLLYRVHKYVVSRQYLHQLATGQAAAARKASSWRHQNDHNNNNSGNNSSNNNNNSHHHNSHHGAEPSGKKKGGGGDERHKHTRNGTLGGGERGKGKGATASGTGNNRGASAAAEDHHSPTNTNNPLRKYTDGMHCFDQIITEQNMTDAEIMEKLKSFQGPAGDLAVFYR